MSDEVHISDCKERVALDLAMKIALDSGAQKTERTREWWLKLFSQCHKAVVWGWDHEAALKEK